MAQATFSVRMNPSLKLEFSSICREIGINMSTAINIFACAVVNQRKIPFEVSAPSNELKNYKNALMKMRSQISNSKIDILSLKEINSIIEDTRKSRKSR